MNDDSAKGATTSPLVSIAPSVSIPSTTLETLRQRRELAEAFHWYKPKAIREQKTYLHCPPSCYPAYLAGRLCRIGWQWAFTLTATPKSFPEYYDEWLPFIQGLQPPAFWTYVISSPEKQKVIPGVHPLHIHGAIGGVFSYSEMKSLLAEWPGFKRLRKIRGYKNAWTWVHYSYSQVKVTKENPFAHYQDRLSHCHNLFAPPYDSENLEMLARDYWAEQKAKAGKRSGAGKGAAWRRERARRGGLAKAAKRRESEDDGRVLLL